VKKLGAGHSDTLTTLDNLAGAYKATGKLPEAIALFEQVRDARVKKLGADHPDTLTTLDNLAGAYMATGKLPEAIALLEQVRDAKVKKLGADHPQTLTTLHNLALAYQATGNLAEAIALYEQVRDARVKKLGADHPDTLTTLTNLAGAYQAAGKLDQALPHFAQAAAGIEKRRFQHQHASLSIANTIVAYEQAKQFDQGEVWRRKWLAVVKQQAGTNSPAYADQLAALGRNLLRQEKWADAETTLRECLAIREKTQPDDWTTFNTMSLLGGALLGQKKYGDAEPLLVKGFEGMKQRAGKIPPQSRSRLTEGIDRLIALYEAQGKPNEAAKWRKQRQALPHTAAPKQSEQQVPAKSSTGDPAPTDAFQLADKRLAEGKVPEAIKLFAQLHKERKDKLGADHPLTRAALHGLGRAWLAHGEGNKAVKYLEQCRDLCNKVFPSPPDMPAVNLSLANAYRSIGKLAEAIRLFEATVKEYRVKLGPEHPTTLLASIDLGAAYAEAGKHDEASRLLDQTGKTLVVKLGPDHPATLQTQTKLVRVHLAAKKYTLTETMARPVVDRWQKRIDRMSNLGQIERELAGLAGLQFLLGESLLRQRKYAEAEPLLVKSYEVMKAREKPVKSPAARQMVEVLDRLIELATATNRPADVKKWQTERSNYRSPKEPTKK
jgi:tetratricopeptide (TPR) repeat protein